MKITVLGSGVCASDLPNIPNRQPPGFLAEWDDQKIMFDCSEAIRFRLEQAGVEYDNIHHLAITHSHPDHFALVHYIQSVFCRPSMGHLGKKNELMQIYCPDKIAKEFDGLWNFYLGEWPDKYPYPKLVFNPMSAGNKIFNIGSGKLAAKKVFHAWGKVDALAYKLETPEGTFAYSGDSGPCDGLEFVANDASLFVCEASAQIGDFKNSVEYGHINPFQAGEISKKANVKKLILTHYTGLDSDHAMMDECRKSGFAGEIIIAKDFQIFNI